MAKIGGKEDNKKDKKTSGKKIVLHYYHYTKANGATGLRSKFEEVEVEKKWKRFKRNILPKRK